MALSSRLLYLPILAINLFKSRDMEIGRGLGAGGLQFHFQRSVPTSIIHQNSLSHSYFPFGLFHLNLSPTETRGMTYFITNLVFFINLHYWCFLSHNTDQDLVSDKQPGNSNWFHGKTSISHAPKKFGFAFYLREDAISYLGTLCQRNPLLYPLYTTRDPKDIASIY